jgi:hypothetical protein
MILKAVKPVAQIQVLKGYVPEEWTSRQESFYRRRRQTKYSTGEQWTKELIEFFWTHGNTFGKSGAQSHTYLEKTA